MSERALDQDATLAGSTASSTRNDRLSELLVLIVALAAFGAGVLIRQQSVTENWYYESRTAGISAFYPAGWLVDETGESVARIWNPRAARFKTAFVIDIVAAGGQASVRNVLDNLTLQRSADLAAYRVLSVDTVQVGGIVGTQMDFVFVDSDPNPFMEHLPVVVRGTDIVFLDANRAIIVTYMADESSFEAGQLLFERFFASLRY